MERNVEQMYWDLVNLRSHADNLERKVQELNQRLERAEERIARAEQNIGENMSAALEAIDESSRDWRQNR
jgi:peptidoglycan hydrolase CwlO-like protein